MAATDLSDRADLVAVLVVDGVLDVGPQELGHLADDEHRLGQNCHLADLGAIGDPERRPCRWPSLPTRCHSAVGARAASRATLASLLLYLPGGSPAVDGWWIDLLTSTREAT